MRSFIFVCIIGLSLAYDSDKPHVTIEDGTLEGLVMSDYNGEKFYGFKGIPYAKPPVCDRRFKEAVKNDPWNCVLDATKDAPVCVQPTFFETEQIGTEDCLYLNVYTNSLDTNSSKPVMLYIHGGKFVLGDGVEFGAEYLMPEDIVLVTINYRLGVFGFVNMEDSDQIADKEAMVANNGFRDQILAMKWVQSNIQHFGGDPNLVTIAGESAGGMSVHAHVLSPLSKGLFHRAIAMSGSSLMVLMYTANNTAIGIAEYLGINTTDHNAMVNELKYAKVEDLYKAQKALEWFDLHQDRLSVTALVVEKPGPNSFLSDYPFHIMKSGKYNKVPMLMGTTNREGLFIHSLTQKNIKQLNTHIPFFFKDRKEATDKVDAFYKISETSDANNISLYTDIWFRYNIFRTAVEHSRHENNVYFYQFAGDGDLNYLKPVVTTISNYTGACHADELGYLFKIRRLPEAKSDSMADHLIKLMVTIWSNFVKTGVPYDNWSPFQPQSTHFANITNDGLQFGFVGDNALKFWGDMYEQYGDGNY